jgi:sugar lactone lactonase YvrE
MNMITTPLAGPLSIGLFAALPVSLWAQGIALNPAPSRVIGQVSTQVVTTRPNLVEGRELNTPFGAAVDTANGILWVADTGNSRVLGWRNPNFAENAAKADFVLGQRTLIASEPLGPGSSFSSGLNSPTSVAVDSHGNVFVGDAGNNRIVRYPNPSSFPAGEPVLVDLVIGQPGLATRGGNQGGLSERSLLTLSGQLVYHMALAFDSQGNLWASDPGNHRVLRYPSGAIGDGAVNNPAANLVLGQPDFRTAARLPESTDDRVRSRKDAMAIPGGLTLDAAGRLFVCDILNRVLVYRPPFANGMEAARVMGIRAPLVQGQPAPPPINERTMGVYANNRFFPPRRRLHDRQHPLRRRHQRQPDFALRPVRSVASRDHSVFSERTRRDRPGRLHTNRNPAQPRPR